MLSRDLIDLAFMAAGWGGEALDQGLSVAERAYGDVVVGELIAALDLMEDGGYRQGCTADLGRL